MSFFSPAPRPADEAERQRAVDMSGLRGAGSLRPLHEIVAHAARLFGAPMAAVSIVDHDRQWFVARIGLLMPESSRAASFCAHAILRPDEPFVVRDTWRDQRFAGNPLVVQDPHLRFYAGVPICAPHGQPLGALCVLDRSSRAGALPIDQLGWLATRTAGIIADLPKDRADTVE